MNVFRVHATDEHGRRWLVAVVEARDARGAVAGHLAGGKTVAGRKYAAERVRT